MASITVPALSAFSQDRGQSLRHPSTGSTISKPVSYNVDIPTGSAVRTYNKVGCSVQIVNPNGEGTCVPLLVGGASISLQILNDSALTTQADEDDYANLTALLLDAINTLTPPLSA